MFEIEINKWHFAMFLFVPLPCLFLHPHSKVDHQVLEIIEEASVHSPWIECFSFFVCRDGNLLPRVLRLLGQRLIVPGETLGNWNANRYGAVNQIRDQPLVREPEDSGFRDWCQDGRH